ncbi:hypothetical protein HAX54_045041 [Datura stramonium]|uniref:Uncharacterized protein n=1 Tax=Datura stramonium TaxID=4076 RepID=A0ABS8WJ16_DATST|nr:hypothetical protein [Datura stramonium]
MAPTLTSPISFRERISSSHVSQLVDRPNDYPLRQYQLQLIWINVGSEWSQARILRGLIRTTPAELSGSVESSPTTTRFKPGHTRSRSDSYPLIYSGRSSVNSPALNSFPNWQYLPFRRVEEKRNENYKKGNFTEALNFDDKAIEISPGNAAYHCNRAAALMGLKRVAEAVKECEEAIRLDPSYFRAHQRLGSLLLSLGQIENARNHMCILNKPDQGDLVKLQTVEKHIENALMPVKVSDWWSTLREVDAVIASELMHLLRAEALLKLHRLKDAELSLSNARKYESSTLGSQSKIFGMLSEDALLFVQSQLELALGRCENALTTIERAGQIDPRSIEVSVLFKNVKVGLRLDSSNAVLYCNRAELAGTNSAVEEIRMIAIKLSVFSQIILKPFFERLPQTPR